MSAYSVFNITTLMVSLLTILTACNANNTYYTRLYHHIPVNEDIEFKILFDIEESFSLLRTENMDVIKVRVKRGQFSAKYKTEQGVFFKGDDGCMIRSGTFSDTTMTDTGGFFIPFDKNKPIRLWHEISRQELIDISKNATFMHRSDRTAYGSVSGGVHNYNRSGIALSPPISSINDREIRLLVANEIKGVNTLLLTAP
ncbi:MAG: hypothetical protein KZQ93_20250 [Candidatus Thiodiazotropha sp. (ex Monitilora ramsayi)]|nr:hypothetical protein [Candidatus Thiodiazotropha sp. (ex Monitilora ramsayi)]